MKNIVFLFLILTTLIYSCSNKRIGVIEDAITPLSYEWGTSFIGDTIKAQFYYINKREVPSVIDYVQTPCGCITAIPEYYYINHGDSTIVNVQFISSDLGYTEKNLFLYLKGEKTPIHFMIKGKIVRYSKK